MNPDRLDRAVKVLWWVSMIATIAAWLVVFYKSAVGPVDGIAGPIVIGVLGVTIIFVIDPR